MRLTASLLPSLLLLGCAASQQSGSTTPKPTGTTESEWVAASDLAATLARAAGGTRVAPAMRIREPGPEVHRKLTLAAAGCYHVGIAWIFASDLQTTVTIDPGWPTQKAMPARKIGAPGGSIDFCTDHPGPVGLSMRPLGTSMPDMLELAVVYGAAPAPAAPAHAKPAAGKPVEPKHGMTRQARTVAR